MSIMLSEQFLEVINSLISGDRSKFNEFIENYCRLNSINSSSTLDLIKIKEEMQSIYYQALSDFLASKKFELFRQLFDYSDKLEIFIDVKKIPNRFKIISDLHLQGIQSGQIGDIFPIIRFYNEYNLFDREFTDTELNLVENIKRDKVLISNLEDLYGKVTDALIWYSCKIMPYDLYLIYINNNPTFPDEEFFSRNYYNLNFLKRFFDRYSIYGLSVEKLGHIKDFISFLDKTYLIPKQTTSNIDIKLIEFKYKRKIHLVSLSNIIKNYDMILDYKNHYKFYSLSMVLIGGLGPQGHGFTYSTPRGEVIEICSDRKENHAIIIKYKEFLKQQFLIKFEKVLVDKNIDTNKIKKIIKYLSNILKPEDIINYFNKGIILNQINSFFNENLEFSFKNEAEFQDIMKKISNAIKILLRPIKMVDQFKCRMDLVEEDKIQSEDIAKLTSLKGKSHYDVLRERIFFQNEIKWFYKDYANDLIKSAVKF